MDDDAAGMAITLAQRLLECHRRSQPDPDAPFDLAVRVIFPGSTAEARVTHRRHDDG